MYKNKNVIAIKRFIIFFYIFMSEIFDFTMKKYSLYIYILIMS